MKAMRKLIPALCLLLISAVLMGTSTYAWFAMNTTVKSTGMKVKVNTVSTLLISKSSTQNNEAPLKKLTNGAAAAEYTAAAVALKPTSTVNGTDWFTAKAAATNNVAAISDSYAAVGAGSVDSYRLANTLYLQTYDSDKATASSFVASAQRLVVQSITVTHSGSEDLSNCFRVMVVIVDENKVICAPTTTTEPTNQGVASVNASGTATLNDITYADVTGIETGKATLSDHNVLIENMNINQVYTANVYIYFDGEDPNCFTDNIPAALNEYTVDITFALVDIPTP